jgi:RNA-directed DNA polymerase
MPLSGGINTLFFNTLQLPMFKDIHELSRLTGLSSRLLYCLSIKNNQFYKTFAIPKKSGSERIINAPSYSMSIMQKWVLRNLLEKVMPSNRAMAFRKGNLFGCKINAKYHAGTLYGLSIDLEDFFPSIKSNKVYYLFQNMGYNNLSSSILTNICTLNGELPQGGICSPSISNLICINLDNRLTGLCEKRGIRYTRYADDMYFSCDNKDLLRKTFPIIKEIIEDENFKINDKKTRYHTPSNRNQITGIVIVKKQNSDEYEIKAKRQFKQNLRAKILKCITTGDYSDKDYIIGLISYINFVQSENESNYLKSIRNYIIKCSEKIIYFKELVEKYNQNLFFKHLPQIEYLKSSFDVFLYEPDGYEHLSYILDCRKDYLMANKYKDICKYEDFPKIEDFPIITEDDLIDDILPF